MAVPASTSLVVQQMFSNVTLSTMIVLFIQWLKDSKYFPWITAQTETLNKILGAFLAFIASIGVQYSYHEGVVTITFTVLTVLAGLWHWIQQLMMQHLVYYGIIKPPAASASKP
jgi:uncharacterized membrane protein (DUF441 family)